MRNRAGIIRGSPAGIHEAYLAMLQGQEGGGIVFQDVKVLPGDPDGQEGSDGKKSPVMGSEQTSG